MFLFCAANHHIGLGDGNVLGWVGPLLELRTNVTTGTTEKTVCCTKCLFHSPDSYILESEGGRNKEKGHTSI